MFLSPYHPARKIPIGTRSVTGTMPNGEKFESTLERDLMYLLRFDPNVEHFAAQPVKIQFQDESGRNRSYTPDILIHYRSGITPVLGEVKYREDLHKNIEELRPKIKAASQYAKAQGWRFKIFTDRDIRTPYLINAKFLLPYLNATPEPAAIQKVLDGLSGYPNKEVGSLLNSLCPDLQVKGELLPVIWHLIARRRVGCDLELPLNMQSLVWPQEG